MIVEEIESLSVIPQNVSERTFHRNIFTNLQKNCYVIDHRKEEKKDVF